METQKNNPNYIVPINIKNFQGSFKVAKDIFNILKTFDGLILWQKSENEMFLFTKEKRDGFYHAMCIESGFSLNDIKWNTKGRLLDTSLRASSQNLETVKGNIIKVSSDNRLKNLLKGKNFSVSFYI